MTTKMIGPLDASWLMMESETNLLHVAGLLLFTLPADAPPNFVHRIVEEMRRHPSATPPLNRRPDPSLPGRLWPRWEIVETVDLDYHLRHTALPWPGGERELAMLISHLHSTPLDKSRPLWTCHVIEGLENNRFAIYLKVHHALSDGVGLMRIMQSTLSEDPDQQDMPPPWAYRKPSRKRRLAPEEAAAAVAADAPRMLIRQALTPMKSAPGLARTVGGLGAATWRMARDSRIRPYTAPGSVLNTPITAHRRFATQSYEMARIRALTAKAGCTVNDVVLAVCGGGLRRYLTEIDALPRQPLVATLPVSVRPAGSDESTGNAVTFAFATLATDIADARQRLATITASTAQSKQHLSQLPRGAIDGYTTMVMSPMILGQVVGVGARGRPMFNLTISNVPGPRRRLYLNGAPLEEMYPVSVVLAGQALNITVVSYVDRLNFAFTACGSRLPRVQRLSVYCGEALAELEKAYAG